MTTNNKTHQTAAVIIPPKACWEPIQEIRRIHDRQIHRWMPHITMLYPFRPADQFDDIAQDLAKAVESIEPFLLRLAAFRFFHHGCGSYTLWLAPEPVDPVKRLQKQLELAAPDLNDVSRFKTGFTPHLSVGQFKGRAELENTKAGLQSSWKPLSFTVEQIALIRRNPAPDDVFRVDRSIPLGSSHRAGGS